MQLLARVDGIGDQRPFERALRAAGLSCSDPAAVGAQDWPAAATAGARQPHDAKFYVVEADDARQIDDAIDASGPFNTLSKGRPDFVVLDRRQPPSHPAVQF